MLCAGLAATLVSGEYHVSWLYLLPDVAEAVAGAVAGVAIDRAVRSRTGKGDGLAPQSQGNALAGPRP